MPPALRFGMPRDRLDELRTLIAQLFGSGEQGAMYIPQPQLHGQQVLYQDAAGTVPVMSDGDPVGLMLDVSGNDNHATQGTSAARPLYRTDGTLHWLEFDGVDDSLTAAAFQHAAAWRAFAAAMNLSSTGSVFDSVSQAQQIRNISGDFGCVRYSAAGDASVLTTNVAVGASVRMLTSIADTDSSRLRLDGAAIYSQAYSEPPSARVAELHIGARVRSSSQQADMDFYGGIYVCSDTQEIEQAESYLANLAGVTL
jgi:hypothetical protein